MPNTANIVPKKYVIKAASKFCKSRDPKKMKNRSIRVTPVETMTALPFKSLKNLIMVLFTKVNYQQML